LNSRFPLLLVCFFLSGFAALLYETVWTREFGFVFGTSELAVAAVLAAYMAGLALGAAVAGRLARRVRRPVLAYGALELGIAVGALAVPLGIRAATALYVALFGGRPSLPDGGGLGTAVFHLLASFAILMPCTALMGATLPLLTRHAVRRDEQVGPRVGALYAINTAGAIAGTLCAAFLLLPELGLRCTVYVGVAVNALIFVAAAWLARGAQLPALPREALAAVALRARWILPAMAVSGAVSFIYEVLWVRLLGLVLGGSVYAFATMLASFLLGITLGSAAAARLARSPEASTRGFAFAQLGIAALVVAAFAVADQLPALASAIGAGAESANRPISDAAVAIAVLLPATLCIGATFPFAVRMLTATPDGASAASARVYAWNTLGAISGSIAAGFVLLPWLGFAGTLLLGAALNLGLAAASGAAQRPMRWLPIGLSLAGMVALLVLRPQPPWQLLRASPLTRGIGQGDVTYFGVGRSATVLLLDSGRDWQLRTNGLPEAIIDRAGEVPGRYREAHWLGLLPVLTRPETQHLLMIGLGGGGALERLPATLQRVDTIELEPEVVAANRSIAPLRAADPLADPRLVLHINDARGALLLSGEHYDAIVSQPSHPWTAGSSHLYTREFFELVHNRLRGDGVFVQWIGIRFIDGELLRTLVATLLDVFENVEVFAPSPGALLFAASDAGFAPVAEARAALAAAPEDFARHGLHEPEDVLAALVLDTTGAREFARGAPLSTDDDNLLATRSPRLGNAVLDTQTLQALLAPYMPLVALADDLDALRLVRALLDRSEVRRAEVLSESLTGSERATALGWVALGRGRRRVALRQFKAALASEPGAWEAAQAVAVLTGRWPELPDEPPGAAGARAVIQGGEHSQRGEWQALAALDAALAQVRPGDVLFRNAQELRARWRVELGGIDNGAEALALVDVAIARGAPLPIYLLRARAAQLAEQPNAAWSSLAQIAEMLGHNAAAGQLARRALGVANQLPDCPYAERVRSRFKSALR
jgi:spermidine synthase